MVSELDKMMFQTTMEKIINELREINTTLLEQKENSDRKIEQLTNEVYELRREVHSLEYNS